MSQSSQIEEAAGAAEFSGDWVLFGAGNYLSDILDIIQQRGGRVTRLVLNQEEPVAPRTKSLADHLRGLEAPPRVERLEDFLPVPGELYQFGFTVPARRQLVEELRRRFGLTFAQLIHPNAYLGGQVRLGEGVLVGPSVTIGPHTELGEFAFVNRSASLGHDVRLGPYARVGPNATLCGFSRLGAGSLVAAGATVLDRVYIGENSVLGAGALATRDVPDNVVALGVPARVVRANEAAPAAG